MDETELNLFVRSPMRMVEECSRNIQPFVQLRPVQRLHTTGIPFVHRTCTCKHKFKFA